VKRIRGVIFDVDGTLVDSNDAHVRSWLEALERGGYEASYEQIRRLVGMGSDNLLPAAVNVSKETDEGKQLSDWWSEVFKEKHLPRLKAFPQTRELFQRMKEAGLKMVVASSSEEDMLEKLLDLAGATDYVESQTSADDADNSKPDPDIVQAALDKLGLEADEVLMIGDTPYDIEAAGKIGVRVVALRCGGFSDADLYGAIAIYDGPTDLLARYDQSPFTQHNRQAPS